MNALQKHLSECAKRKAQLIRSGELPQSANGGRVAKPTKCVRCGVEQPSARAAWVHKCADNPPAK